MQGGIYGKQIDNLALIIFIPLRITEEKPFSNLSILPSSYNTKVDGINTC